MRRRDDGDDDSLPVMVPRSVQKLVAGMATTTGFLDDRTGMRARRQADMTERAVLRLYLDRVLPVGYGDWYVFHGKQAARWTAQEGHGGVHRGAAAERMLGISI